MFIDGIDISRKYTIEEILDMHAKGRLRPVSAQGYIVRADLDRTEGIGHASESTRLRAP